MLPEPAPRSYWAPLRRQLVGRRARLTPPLVLCAGTQVMNRPSSGGRLLWRPPSPRALRHWLRIAADVSWHPRANGLGSPRLRGALPRAGQSEIGAVLIGPFRLHRPCCCGSLLRAHGTSSLRGGESSLCLVWANVSRMRAHFHASLSLPRRFPFRSVGSVSAGICMPCCPGKKGGKYTPRRCISRAAGHEIMSSCRRVARRSGTTPTGEPTFARA